MNIVNVMKNGGGVVLNSGGGNARGNAIKGSGIYGRQQKAARSGAPVPRRLHLSPVRPGVRADDLAPGADHARTEDAGKHRG